MDRSKRLTLSKKRLSMKDKMKMVRLQRWSPASSAGSSDCPITPSSGGAKPVFVSTPKEGTRKSSRTLDFSPILRNTDDDALDDLNESHDFSHRMQTPSMQDRLDDSWMSGVEMRGNSSESDEDEGRDSDDTSSDDRNTTCSEEEEVSCDESLNETVGDDDQEPVDVSGRRVVDIEHIFGAILGDVHPGPYGCTFVHNRLVSEYRRGLKCVWSFICKMCNKRTVLHSELEAPSRLYVNDAVVHGAIAGGIGYANLAEVTGAMDVPFMTDKTFSHREQIVAEAIAEAATKTMTEAAAKELQMANEAGDVDPRGNGMIAVVADGFWTKRSYNSSYSSKSGVACIVGAKTKKILFLGIRNKFCSVCALAQSKGKEVPEHKCFRNWSGSSTSMEGDIIAEGFLRSESMHKLKYTTLIADGDSSVHSRLLALQPYGSRCLVKKVECRNHLSRNYRKNLKEITSRTQYPLKQRQFLGKVFLKIVNGVWASAKHWNKDTENPLIRRVELLHKDIISGPAHYFGNHEHCATYFCTGPKDGETDVFTEFTRDKSELWDAVMSLANRVAQFSGSLIYNLDNNLAEQFNSVLAQRVNGKRVNYNQRGGVNTRALSAVAAVNTSGQYHLAVQQAAAVRVGKHTAAHFDKRVGRLHKKRDWRKEQRELGVQRAAVHPRDEADRHYGLQAVSTFQARPRKTDAELVPLKDAFMQDLYKDREAIERRTAQALLLGDTDDWLHIRAMGLPSSMHGTVAKLREKTSCVETIFKIMYDRRDNKYFAHGRLWESEAKRQVGLKLGVEVKHCGIFRDEVCPWLTTTPDGLIGEDYVVEVKCPLSADPFKTLEEAMAAGKPPYLEVRPNGEVQLKRSHDYYYQVQSQIHIPQKKGCFFGVYGASHKWLHVEYIPEDRPFWAEHVGKYNRFYYDCQLPEILDPQYRNRLKKEDIRDPPYRTGSKGKGGQPAL